MAKVFPTCSQFSFSLFINILASFSWEEGKVEEILHAGGGTLRGGLWFTEANKGCCWEVEEQEDL